MPSPFYASQEILITNPTSNAPEN